MLLDERMKKLADILVNYSCKVQEGEKVLIESSGVPVEMVGAIVREVYKAKGYPFVELSDSRVEREILLGLNEEMAKAWAKYDAYRMDDMDAYIGLRGGNNCLETSDVPSEKMSVYSRLYGDKVHGDIRVNNTKWVILRWPTEGMSQLAKMSTDAFEDYYFNVCSLDYAKMNKAMDDLKALMDKTDKVRIVAKDTDLSFSIKGMGSVKCSGECNIPDGELYTAPVKNSVNGYIHYNVPSIENGIEFNDVRLTFKDGKIVEATANRTEEANAIFDEDEGARYVGEFSFGLNPYINKAIGDILFDEKISGSIHFTPGACYEDCDNGNKSSVHWDLVLCQTKEYGGGEVWFDDVLIRKDGLFVPDELKGLNPENLR
ncbi:MAG: aminopeptidase [Clostridia bacterium]|nr:aminopeptidase [Clostridia bacterium]